MTIKKTVIVCDECSRSTDGDVDKNGFVEVAVSGECQSWDFCTYCRGKRPSEIHVLRQWAKRNFIEPAKLNELMEL